MKFVIIWLIFFSLAIFLFHSSLDYFFFQDDFFEINISQTKSLKDYLSFFKFRDDIIAYRPISLQNYFFVSYSLFGLNPTGFRTISFSLFLVCSLLIYKIASYLLKNKFIGFLSVFFWLFSSIHFMSLTWIAAAYNIIGTFFWLLTTILFLIFLKSKNKRDYFLSMFSFILCVGSFEFSVTWPIIFGFYYFFVSKKPLFKTFKIFSPYLLISTAYFLLRLFFIEIPQIPEYKVTFDSGSLKAFFWYVAWTFNIPEEFKKQIVSNLIYFNPVFLSEFWPLVVKSFTGLSWILILTITIPIYKILRNQISINSRLVIFMLVWFVTAITPVLIIPNHTFTMYLTLASIGIYMLLAYLLVKVREKFLIYFVVLIWISLSINTLNFYRLNSWMIEAQKTARVTISDLKSQFPTLPSNSIVYYYLPFSWQHQSLAGQEAIKTAYSDPTLTIYYNKKALLQGFAKWGNLKPVYIYLPDEK